MTDIGRNGTWIVIAIVSVIVLFSVIAGTWSTAGSAGDSLSDQGKCEALTAVNSTFNGSTKVAACSFSTTTELCTWSKNATRKLTACNSIDYTGSVSKLFRKDSIVFVVLIAAVLMAAVGLFWKSKHK